MKRLIPLMLCVAACTAADDTDTSGPADVPTEPGTETRTAQFDVDLFSMYDSPTIASFDTRDGALVLTGMTIRFDHTATIDVFVENASDFAVEADDYVWDYYFNTLAQLGLADGTETEDGGGPPFFGPGSYWIQVSEPLAAADGASRAGPDYWSDTVVETVNFEADYSPEEHPTYLDAMTDAGDVTVVVGGFTESFLNWDESVPEGGLLFAEATAIQYTGTITIDYHYELAE